MGSVLLRAWLASRCIVELLADWLWKEWDGDRLLIEDGEWKILMVYAREDDETVMFFGRGEFYERATCELQKLVCVEQIVKGLLELRPDMDYILAKAACDPNRVQVSRL